MEQKSKVKLPDHIYEMRKFYGIFEPLGTTGEVKDVGERLRSPETIA